MLLSPLTELNFDDFDRMHRTNVRGAFVVSQQAARRVRKGGAIINFSTSVTKIAVPGYTAYAATKGAVDAMTLILAKEMRGRDVTVNAVAPGPTATPLYFEGKPQEVIDRAKAASTAGATRGARGHRRGGRVPRWPGALGQRPGHLRQRRGRLMSESKVILVTGASSGFGALTVRALADANHVVYAGMRDIAGRNAESAAVARRYADEHGVELRAVDMDVSDQGSVDRAVASVLGEAGRIDVVIHNAGHMVLGPTEAFTPEQVAAVYDTNVLSTQRVNRAVLPHLRQRGDGLVVWVGSSSSRGGTPPYLGPYFAAKAAEDALAVSYAAELTRFGIETTIVVPGVFTSGTNHFANAGHPADEPVAAAYEQRYAGLMDDVGRKLAELAPADADAGEVAREIVRVVDTPKGKRPFRIYVDPADDGAEDVFRVGDRVRQWFYQRIGYSDLLSVGRPATPK